MLFGFMLLASWGPSWAAFIEDKDARLAILELRKQVESLRQQSERMTREAQAVADDNLQMRKAMLELQNQIDALRTDLSQARGDRDLLTRELSETQRRLKDQAQGVDDRLRKIEPLKVKINGTDYEVEPAESKDYEQSLGSFRKGDFATAAVLFNDFTRHYPNSPYLTSSYFWLGNAQYAMRDYKSSMATFRQLIESAPQDPRVPESWLAIANCQLEMKDLKAARKTLEDLIKFHPASEAASAAKERLSKLK